MSQENKSNFGVTVSGLDEE